jgi:hypothetical protein
MKKKIFVVVLLSVVLLATPFIGTVMAVGGGALLNRPTFATYEYSIELWAVPDEDERALFGYEVIEGDKVSGWKNLMTYGGAYDGVYFDHDLGPDYPFVETYIPIPNTDPPLTGVLVNDWGKGGIKLTLTIGENEYELVGTVTKFMPLVATYEHGMFIDAEWTFTIVDVGDDAAALGAVGSTLEGWTVNRNGNFVVHSTDGTGFFEGAKLRGTQYTTPHPIIDPTTVPPSFTGSLFTVETGWGTIKLYP